MSIFIDFHVLQLVPPSCINRDDTGSPKSARFGGVERHRVSSQAWKRAVRNDFAAHLNSEELGERTKYVVAKVAEKLVEIRSDISPEDALKHATAVLKAADIKVDDKKPEQTAYLLFLSRQEIQNFAEAAARVADGEKLGKKAARELLMGDGAIDVALFGRMLADAPERNVDAACQVEHALSVHKAIPEFDYYTAIDDNAPEDNAGAGMIGTTEFVSSTLYRYATINVDKLVANLGSEEAAAHAVEAFTRSFVLSMPTGKQNSFANRTRPDFVLVEVRSDQPTSLVNAFEEPVANNGTALRDAAIALANHAVDEDKQYGIDPTISSYLATERVNSEALKDALAGRSELSDLQGIIDRIGAVVRDTQ